MSVILLEEMMQNIIIALEDAQGSGLASTAAIEAAMIRMLNSTNHVPPPVILGNGSNAISLNVSSDLYQGQFANVAFSVDGRSVGTETISALHSVGQSQVVTLDGDWGLGTHVVTATLQNPAPNYGLDVGRIAYVTPVSYDGAAQFGAGATVSGAAGKSLSLVSATTYSSGAAGGRVAPFGHDTVLMGTGAETIDAMGPSVSVAGGAGALTFLGHTGSDTISAGSGSIYVTPGTGSLAMSVGSGSSTIASGMGREIFTVVNGSAGGDLIINNFVPGNDIVHLVGFNGSGIQSQIIGHSSSQFTLTDNTTIIVTGFRDIGAGSVFG